MFARWKRARGNTREAAAEGGRGGLTAASATCSATNGREYLHLHQQSTIPHAPLPLPPSNPHHHAIGHRTRDAVAAGAQGKRGPKDAGSEVAEGGVTCVVHASRITRQTSHTTCHTSHVTRHNHLHHRHKHARGNMRNGGARTRISRRLWRTKR